MAHGSAPSRHSPTRVAFAQRNHRVSATIHVPPTLESSSDVLAQRSTEGDYLNQMSHSIIKDYSTDTSSIKPSEAPDILGKKASMRSRVFQFGRSEPHAFRAPSELRFTTAREYTNIEIPKVSTGDESTELSPEVNILTPRRRPLSPLPSGARGHRRQSAVIDVGEFGGELESGAILMVSPPPIRTPESVAAAAHDRALTVRAELLHEDSQAESQAEAGGNHEKSRDCMGSESGSDQAELKNSFGLKQWRKTTPGNSGKRVTWSDPLTLTQTFSTETETLKEDPAHSDQDEGVASGYEDWEGTGDEVEGAGDNDDISETAPEGY
ncbi:hypothetical protein L211DRAFT_850500 [Terfezia boudieri ATCC MYA-4762]|uniref:Uncharacterized protein n=1 Tax=Terfezia boudieri ATCC MYA-4762 TaxID=1051890 RepID=A0A3N4LLU8_9PEZI|nr:hypothetical protein L211DRAFT_850500 [Terfezia boudieri ATCC MYA-4762]